MIIIGSGGFLVDLLFMWVLINVEGRFIYASPEHLDKVQDLRMLPSRVQATSRILLTYNLTPQETQPSRALFHPVVLMISGTPFIHSTT